MVPEGWSLCKLEELALVERGKFSARPRNDPKYYGGVIPFVQTGDVSATGTFLTEYSQTLNDEGLKVSRIFPKNSILITIAANIGDTAIATFNVACPDSVVAIQSYKEKSDYFWLKNILETFKKKLDAQATQNAQKNINLQVLRPLLIKTPPLPEQKKIARILSTWDKAIETVEKLIENSKAQKKALMQQLLTGKRRLPGFDREWKAYKLNEIFYFKKGKGLSKVEVNSDGKYKCILYGELYTKYAEIIHTVVSRTNSSDGFASVAGDVLIPCSTTTSGIDLANATCLQESDVMLGGDITVLRPKNKNITSDFIAYLLTHIKKHEIARLAQGITIIHLYGKDLKNIAITLPSINEQKEIVNVVKNSDKEIEIMNVQLHQLQAEKKALMQQLLTGKQRVKLEASG